LKKREEFAISLRKKKTKEIIKEKRRKMMESMAKKDNAERSHLKSDSYFNGNPDFQRDEQQYRQLL